MSYPSSRFTKRKRPTQGGAFTGCEGIEPPKQPFTENLNEINSMKNASTTQSTNHTPNLLAAFNPTKPHCMMNLQQLDQLERIEKRLNELSALTFVVKGSVENMMRDYEANLDINTANVELVLSSVGYDLAELHEDLGNPLKAIPKEYKRSLRMQAINANQVIATKVSKQLKAAEGAQA